MKEHPKKADLSGDSVPLLQLERICAELPANESFRNLSIKMMPGELVAILSVRPYDLENLADVLNGRIDCSGEIRMKGNLIPPAKIKEHIIPIIIRESSLVPQFSIAQNLFMHERFITKHGAKRRAQEELASVGLQIDLRRSVKSLNSSETRLIELLRQYITGNDFLVLYDFANFLEGQYLPVFRQIIARAKLQNKGALYLTTNIDEALMYSDRIYLLGNGGVIAEYKTEMVKNNPRNLIYLMSGMDYGYLENQEKRQVLESIIETRDMFISQSALEDTLIQLSDNIAKILEAKGCAIYIAVPSVPVRVDAHGRATAESGILKSYLSSHWGKELFPNKRRMLFT